MFTTELVGDARIALADCEKYLAEVADASVDLVVTSPPYDHLRTYGGNEWSFDKFTAIAPSLVRVLKPGGVIVWVVGDATICGSETGTSFRQALHFMELGLNLHDTMIYIKRGGLNSGSLKAYQQKFEYMFVLSKGTPKSINLIRDRRNKHIVDREVKKRRADGSYTMQHVTTGEYGVRYNYWEYDTGAGKSGFGGEAAKHPAMFPLPLAYDHVLSWSNPGDTVLDPFMGSGTTALACHMCGRLFVGCEINPDYYALARRRIAKSADTLF